MILRKGRTKTLLEKSINSALIAVEIYNKPRIPFKVESYTTNMIMAWTKLFLAYFHNKIGDKYYYKDKKGRYKEQNGHRLAWDLNTCIKKYTKLSEEEKANLDFFIGLRNRIEHMYVELDEIKTLIFGECQSLLYNYENILISMFGEKYALNENLAFSLQFSRIRSNDQLKASKMLLSTEVRKIKDFIEKYRSNLKKEVFDSQTYSIKLIQIPKISNTKRNDLAIEFVKWNPLSELDKEKFQKIEVLIKDKVIIKDAINAGKLKPGQVLKKINATFPNLKISHMDLKRLYYIFSIRPVAEDGKDSNPFDTNTKYCHYDEAHGDYLYQMVWIDFLIKNISEKKLSPCIWNSLFKRQKKVNIEIYEK